jgi:apolipoprotein N-acyltransferase
MLAILPRLLAALLSGAMLILVSPPIGWDWLHWFCFLPLYWALRPGSAKTNAKLGYAAGWMGVFILFIWIGETVVRFSNLPWILSMLTVVLFASVFALPYALVFGPVHWLRSRLGSWWVVVVPAIQVTTEQLSPALFPYYHGVGQYQAPWVWQLASVTGVMGLSYLIFLTNAALAEAMYRWQEGRAQPWRLHGAVALIFIGNLGFGAYRHSAVEAQLAEARSIRVALIQQNKTMEVRMAESIFESIDSWVVRTAKVVADKPDLVIWPEGSVHVNPDMTKRRFKRLGKRSPRDFFETLAKTGDFHLLVGGGTRGRMRLPDGGELITAYNSAYSFSRDGHLGQRYDKMVPLPFGEYIPFAETFPILREWIKGPGNFRAGKVATIFEAKDAQGQRYTYSVPICYEAILLGQMWEMAEADVFVNITNDAWFGDTASPHQHAMLAAAMSTQFGRPMVRVAYSGISFVVDPHGDIRDAQAPFTESTTVARLPLLRIDTVYRRGGWIFPWLCVLGTLVAVMIARRREPEVEQ